MTVTHQGITAAVVESGRVLDVDISNYTLVVTTQYSKKPQTGICWSSPYTHFVNGEGVYIMPEVGSLCWVCFPSDGNRPFVLGWAPAGDEGDYRSRRQNLNPGDIYLGTRDENFLILRRGGIVQMGGGPLCQRIFLPVNNTIRDFCENYALHTIGGDLTWTVERSENDTDGKRPTTLSILARELANDAKPIAELLIGSHGSGDKTILSLKIKESGEDGAASKIELKLDKDGNIKWDVKKDVEWKIEGKASGEVKGAVDFKFKDTATFTVTKKLTLKSDDDIDITSGGTITLKGSKVVAKEKLDVGSATYAVVLDGPAFKAFVNHMHPFVDFSGMTGPPTPPLVSYSSQDLKTS